MESISMLFPSSQVKFSHSSGFISVNTQARRLGVICFIINAIYEGRRMEKLLLSLPEPQLEMLRKNLHENCYKTGLLTSKPSSMRHYLDLLKDLDFVVQQGGIYSLTPMGDALGYLYQKNCQSPYPLHPSIRSFLLLHLLKYDFFGISTLTSLLNKNSISLIDIIKQYKERITQRLTLGMNKCTNERMLGQLRDRILEIKRWRKPIKYSEHLVSARVNWLMDLSILKTVRVNSRSNISIASEYLHLAKYLRGVQYPTEQDFLTIIQYYNNIGWEEEPLEMKANASDNQIEELKLCQALCDLFDFFSKRSKLAKIRTDVFVSIIISDYFNILKVLSKTKQTIFNENYTRKCKDYNYTYYPAARSTQSYIIRDYQI